ncbi:50S ribosomal protein L11 [Candidatus Pacearchaeota archaeon]|nr:50S ribosomal protein L11 [Candidatus Pacearchaeota archaeon]
MAIIKLIVDGGAMKPGPTIAQQLGPKGINIGKVIEDINKATIGFKGVKVPVELDVNEKTKKYEIRVSSPPVAELLKKELGLEKGSGEAGKIKIANAGIENIIGIAKTKLPNMLARDLKNAVKLVLGSCVSLGILVENKSPIEVIAEVNSGKFDNEIKQEKTEVSALKKTELAEYFAKVKAQQESRAKAEAEALAAAEAEKAAAAGTTAAAPGAPATATAGTATAPAAEATKTPAGKAPAAKAEAKKEDKKK